ncbi:hypothetical protein [Treponema endosymbiont of Eucomonympha sp.]|uniref:hypothetical protein n=1 Tax=Treponema endosymbiont of Eucomonympha sp. TaxID=1580831 RepID=UPI000AA5E3F2|nr:hypothetical protein [Treponema endosymbiont of Eucomonympha sp.]
MSLAARGEIWAKTRDLFLCRILSKNSNIILMGNAYTIEDKYNNVARKLCG